MLTVTAKGLAVPAPPEQPDVSMKLKRLCHWQNLGRKTGKRMACQRHAQLVKKASQSFAAGAAKVNRYVFSGDMCVGENTSQAASAELPATDGRWGAQQTVILSVKEGHGLL